MSYASQFNRVNLSTLKGSVGSGGANFPLDVLLVQRLLNGTRHAYPGKQSLVPDGAYGPATGSQIALYQRNVVGMTNPDTLINVNRGTHKSLVASLKPEYLPANTRPTESKNGIRFSSKDCIAGNSRKVST